MSPRSNARTFLPPLLVALALAVVPANGANKKPSADLKLQTPAPAAGAAPEAAAAPHRLAGMEACGECHSDQVENLAKTTHGRTTRTTPEGAAACESCHGPGGAPRVLRDGWFAMRRLRRMRETAKRARQCSRRRGRAAQPWRETLSVSSSSSLLAALDEEALEIVETVEYDLAKGESDPDVTTAHD